MNPQSPNSPILPAPQPGVPVGNPLGVPPSPTAAYGAVPLQPPEQQLSRSAVEAGVTSEDIQTMGSPDMESLGEIDHEGMEKLWEIRAKQIILATATDPFLQHQQLMQLKAEFMQKQYNKRIKLS